jgi:hypothetical protein
LRRSLSEEVRVYLRASVRVRVRAQCACVRAQCACVCACTVCVRAQCACVRARACVHSVRACVRACMHSVRACTVRVHSVHAQCAALIGVALQLEDSARLLKYRLEHL